MLQNREMRVQDFKVPAASSRQRLTEQMPVKGEEMANYLEIKNVSDGYVGKVRQDLKFKTGNFVWKIFFNIPLNPSTVNNQNLTVTNAAGKALSTHITYNSELHAIEIAPKEAYTQGESYFLHVGKLVESRGGQRLKDEISIEFAV